MNPQNRRPPPALPTELWHQIAKDNQLSSVDRGNMTKASRALRDAATQPAKADKDAIEKRALAIVSALVDNITITPASTKALIDNLCLALGDTKIRGVIAPINFTLYDVKCRLCNIFFQALDWPKMRRILMAIFYMNNDVRVECLAKGNSVHAVSISIRTYNGHRQQMEIRPIRPGVASINLALDPTETFTFKAKFLEGHPKKWAAVKVANLSLRWPIELYKEGGTKTKTKNEDEDDEDEDDDKDRVFCFSMPNPQKALDCIFNAFNETAKMGSEIWPRGPLIDLTNLIMATGIFHTENATLFIRKAFTDITIA